MPTAKKSKSPKRQTTPKEKQTTTNKKTSSHKRSLGIVFKTVYLKTRRRTQNFLARRPHRSFRRTRRRDYVRSFKIPGYIAFTHYVLRVLTQHKRVFLGIAIIYGLLMVLFAGLASQETYAQLRESLNDSTTQVANGGLDELGKAGILLISSVTGGLSVSQAVGSLGAQQVVVTTLVLLTAWLATVWLLRGILAGQKPRLRDGLYSSGSPIIPTFLVSLVLIVQLLPLALAMIGLSVASSTGFLMQGVEAMVLWIAGLLLVGLSLYWITSTLFALIVVTLPGMYPMKALRTAGDLVIGRRIRILLRLIWLAAFSGMAWVVIMIPVILFDGWIKRVFPVIADIPIVPVALLIMGSLTVVWSASYMYLLYRKVVDDDAAPA